MRVSDSIAGASIVLAFSHQTIAQDYVQSALIFQGNGFVGAVVDANGCDITYQLTCTTDSSICSGQTRTVTLSGTSSYTMSYTMLTPTGSSTETLVASDTCKLLGTSLAMCTASVSAIVSPETYSTTSTFVVTDQGALGYRQVPITAGPSAALRSVSSCSLNPPTAQSSTPITFASSYAPTSPSTASSTSAPSTPMGASSGLSTGAKAGLGAGLGVGALGALAALGTCLWYRKRKQRTPPPSQESHAAPPPYYGHSKPIYTPQGPYEVHQQPLKHEMAAGPGMQEMPAYVKHYELPTPP